MEFKKIISLLSALVLVSGSAVSCAEKEESKGKETVEYEWSNVAIGGGGYITGIVYNPTEEGLAYVRTDIGGAYRFDKELDKYVPITDFLGGDEWNYIGIESIATDPVEPNRVYFAGGTYMSDPGALFASEDYGKTWNKVEVEFSCGGNQSGRGTGERMKVDPVNNKNIYMGTRNAGLWKSDDYGKSWNKVESFPVKGDYSQEGNNIGIMWIEFAPGTNDIYAGVAMANGECIYKSTDDGATWETLPANNKGMYPLQADISENGNMYMVYSDTCGPNVDPQAGAVYSYNLESGEFTDITPDIDDGRAEGSGGFGGVSVDPQNPDTVVVTSLGYWHDNGDNIYRSADGGKSWNALYTKTEKNFVMDTSEAQWLDWGREEAKTGWWTATVAINPFNSDEVSYGTGATLFSTVNMTDLGTGTPVTIEFDAKGIEETAVFDMISPPTDGSTPQLYSIMGDLTGFAHMDVEVIPDDAHFMKNGAPDSIDCAWLNPDIAVYTSSTPNKALNYTTDGGDTWNVIKRLPEKAEAGKVAVSADGSALIWRSTTLSAKPYVTFDFGETWYFCEGLGYGARIVADRVNPKKFYAVCDGTFYVSEDSGFNFKSTGKVVTDDAEPVAVGDKEGHIWLASGGMVMFTEDGGQNFNVLKNFSAKAIGFGAPEKEGGYMTVYAMGTDEVEGNKNPQGQGIYRSTDKGETWVKLNDEEHLFGNLTYSITGDSEIFGRVYFATNGRGIVMGDIAE
ncbi:MAG: cellulose-binding protein [Ruminococcus sp.]|nr:cellulose-binding protein [Ruminococcus sp.]